MQSGIFFLNYLSWCGINNVNYGVLSLKDIFLSCYPRFSKE